MPAVQSICVFCGSSNRALKKGNKYTDLAVDLGTELASRDIRLIYGGAAVGLMGQLADTVMAGGGEVHGVIPEDMANREVAHQGITKLELVPDMHERKKRMYTQADAFCGLPGGIGTLEELAEVITWNGLGYHNKIKPVVLLDEGRFWDPLWDLLDYMVAEGFLREKWRAWVGRATTPKEALEFLSKIPK